MKNEEMIALGLAAVAVYLIVNTNKKTGAASGGLSATLGNAAKAVSEIFDTAGGQFGNGWRYFSDGTAIDPQGNYYQNGQLIWTNNASPKWSV